jgi:predicted nucleic acid-binding protein
LIVIDASIALSWLFEDELDDLARESAGRVIRETAIVPAIFSAEITNALLAAARKKRIERANLESALRRMAQLPIKIDTATLDLSEEVRLAMKHRLTVYDALYLALACRHGLPLLTRDEALRAAAVSESVSD